MKDAPPRNFARLHSHWLLMADTIYGANLNSMYSYVEANNQRNFSQSKCPHPHLEHGHPRRRRSHASPFQRKCWIDFPCRIGVVDIVDNGNRRNASTTRDPCRDMISGLLSTSGH